MRNIHSHFRHDTIRFSERLICARNLSQASEAMSAQNDILTNKEVKNALTLYDTRILRRDYPELRDPVERTYFYALLLGSMRKNRVPLAQAGRTDLEVFDPLRIIDAARDSNRVINFVKVGQRVESLLPPNEVVALLPVGSTTTGDARLGEIGYSYQQRITDAQQEYNTRGTVTDDVSFEAVIGHYRQTKNALDTILSQSGVRVIRRETAESLQHSDRVVTRSEYVALLTRAWHGDIAGIRAVAQNTNLNSFRSYLFRNVADQNVLTNIEQFEDLMMRELGPTEKLGSFNVTLGQDLVREYVEFRQGKRTALDSVRTTPTVPGIQPVSQAPLPFGESAAEWMQKPKAAYEFLVGRMPDTVENQQFLQALDWYNEQGWPAKPNGVVADVHGMEAQDVRAILMLISQSLMEKEEVIRQTFSQKEKLKKEITGVEAFEKTAADAWEYMKDVRSHPVGSILTWLVGAVVVRRMWKWVTGEHSPAGSLAVMAGVGGALFGLYQKRTTGEAWWNGLAPKMKEWAGIEQKKEPEEQTLPSYWMQELQLSGRREEACLSVLQQQKTGDVIKWYESMNAWEIGGSKQSEQPALPGSITSETRRFRDRFGQATSREIGVLYYRTLKKFFEHRGKAAREEHIPIAMPNGLSDDAALGLAVIRDKYVERNFYHTIVSSVLAVGSVKVDADLIENWDEARVRSFNLTPEQLRNLYIIREGYMREKRERDQADWQMWNVFMLEANPEILRRMGREGIEAAGWIEKLYAETNIIFMNGRAWEITIENGKYIATSIRDSAVYVWDNVSSPGKKIGRWAWQKGNAIYGQYFNGPQPPTNPNPPQSGINPPSNPNAPTNNPPAVPSNPNNPTNTPPTNPTNPNNPTNTPPANPANPAPPRTPPPATPTNPARPSMPPVQPSTNP